MNATLQISQYLPYIVAFFAFLLAVKLLKWVALGLAVVLVFSVFSQSALPSIGQANWKRAASSLVSKHVSPSFLPAQLAK